MSVVEALKAAVAKVADYNRDDTVAPAAILWPDKDRQWEPLAERLRKEVPQFLTLGAYEPEKRIGPAIWIRCMLARALPVDWPENVPLIIYLPGVSRAELRAVEECPLELQPLAELQYRGCFWTHTNGKDWTVVAFLQSKEGGLGLDVAPGPATQVAAQRALLRLASTPVESLRGKRLDANFFTELLTPNFERQILDWLNDVDAASSRVEERTRLEGASTAQWDAFRSRCRRELSFDPQTDGALTAAQALGDRQGAWEKVWSRFVEAPVLYPEIPKWLRRAQPTELLGIPDSWPQLNDAAEKDLGKALAGLRNQPPQVAREKIESLEEAHGKRRQSVWALISQAPLACALEHLTILATATSEPLAGATLEDFAQSYRGTGWKVDAAVLDAVACVEKTADANAISLAVQALYAPWLEAAAERFQELMRQTPPKTHAPGRRVYPPGTCVLFADGLRYDVGQKLKAMLDAQGLQCELDSNWTALPSVTATAKPAVSPVADLFDGDDTGEDFMPIIAASQKVLSADKFTRALADKGLQVLGSKDMGSFQGVGWTEFGDIDRFGHTQGWKLAGYVGKQVSELAQRISDLLAAGWKRVVVVTDHGWLLLPGGLPKAEMPKYLTETRWGRCAVLKTTTKTDLPVIPWYWNPDVRIAVAPGISCFRDKTEFSHGGLSLQECLVPKLTVYADSSAATGVRITSVNWKGLRCRITLEGAPDGCQMDIRTQPAVPGSSVAPEKKAYAVKADGVGSVLIPDEGLINASAYVVILDAQGKLLAQQLTIIGKKD